MEPTVTIMYDFWQFMFFATVFTAVCVWFTYTRAYSTGFDHGYNSLFNDLVNKGVIEIEDEAEEPEDFY